MSVITTSWESLAPPLVLAARLVLALLFGVAGVGKVVRPGSAARAAVQFRVMRKESAAFAVGLGAVELLTAAALLGPPPLATAGCAMAGLLSLSFIAISVPALARGDRFACGCLFGQAHLSWVTPVRAAAMAAGALAALVVYLTGAPAVNAGAVADAIGLTVLVIGLPAAFGTYLTVQAAHRERRRA
ncbi:MauE/DoxX family redox-associated membrane protein [Nonomuraea sp. NPDC050790]|uniref:MauE/DoxX family redox-associated membrane protein n=1 Tax=Nonomuraea sp. NPDC050790 TaxID=3364371 RepID=UPI0037B8BAA4